MNNEGLLHSKDVLNISANTLNNEKNIVAKKATLTIGKTLNNAQNAQISASNQLTIKQTENAGGSLAVNNKGLLYSKDKLTIFANTLDNQKDISANKATLKIKTTLGNSKGARIFIDDTLGVTATTLNNKGHIKTTTLGVTVDNINNATDGKMSAVNAAFTVDTFVNNGSVNSADDLTIQKKTEDKKIVTLDIENQFSFYAGGTFNIVKNDAGMFNINIVDGFVAKGINWVINKLDLKGFLRSSEEFHLDVAGALTLRQKEKSGRDLIVDASKKVEQSVRVLVVDTSKKVEKSGRVLIVDTSKKVEKSYTPTPEKKEEGGGNAMILLSGKQAGNSIKVGGDLNVSAYSLISSVSDLTLMAKLINIAENAAITGFKYLSILGNIDNKGLIYSDKTLDLVAPNYIHNTGKGCVASNGCISSQNQLRIAHSQKALILPSDVSSIVGEMELINQGDIASKDILIVAKKVVNTIPSGSNFGKKDKMVRVSRPIVTKSANYTKIVEVFHEKYLDGFNPDNNRPSISATSGNGNLSILGFKEIQNTGGTLSATNILNLTSGVDGSRVINQSVGLFKVTKTTEQRTRKVCSTGASEVLGVCPAEIACAAGFWLSCIFIGRRVTVKDTPVIGEVREVLKSSANAGLFAKNIVIDAGFVYTGKRNEALSNKEIIDKTRNTGQDDIQETPKEDKESEIESAEVTKSDSTLEEKEVESNKETTGIKYTQAQYDDSMVGNVTESLPANPYGLYLRAQDSNAQYLYERNALYVTDEHSQLDINYLAEKLRIKDTTRKLGNTDFEIQLIKKQAERLNAVSYLEYGDDFTMMQALYDAAAAFVKASKVSLDKASKVSLDKASKVSKVSPDGMPVKSKPMHIMTIPVYGMPLTDSQIDSLDKPIIWEVYQKVASGEVVRVPRLYIPTRFKVKSAMIMATGNTNIDVTYLLNSGGEIKSDSLSIKTKNDLDVISGKISGDTVILDVGGNINLETLKVRRGTVNNYYEELLDKTTISANTGLSIKTKNDLNVMASDITSGGGINIQTGGEVNIKNITLEKGTHSVSHSRSGFLGLNSKETTTTTTTQTSAQSSIQAEGDLSIIAQKNLNIEGANITSQAKVILGSIKGDVNITAQKLVDTKNTTVKEEKFEFNADSDGKEKTADATLSFTTTNTSNVDTTHIGSNISGGNVVIFAKNTANFEGATLGSKGDLVVVFFVSTNFCAVILTSPFMLPKITFAWLVIFAPSMLRFF
jgi:hypothetical protein